MSVDSYTAIHVQNVVFMIVSLFLFRMIDPAESLVQTYITCNIMVFFQVHDHGLLISNKVPYSIGYIKSFIPKSFVFSTIPSDGRL